jgi:hypothetical protein
MLERILETIKVKGDAQKKNVGVNVGVKLSARERDLIELLRLDGTLTAVRIAETYSISTRLTRTPIKLSQEERLYCPRRFG